MQDATPDAAADATTWVVTAMDFCLLFLAHRRHEFHARGLVAMLGLVAKMTNGEGIHLRDGGLDASLKMDALEQARGARPTFTARSGVFRPQWTLWRMPGYFSESAFHKVHHKEKRTTALTSVGMVECQMDTKVGVS
jgi:hypothetical protein